MEVYDTTSDLVVADFRKKQLITSPLTSRKDELETFPTFSPDGNWIYYCSAPIQPLPDSIHNLKYSLCRISFHKDTKEWGRQIETVWDAQKHNGSACHPKISPDGKYLLFTVADYGTFPIWHRETDLHMMNLQTGKIDTLPASTPINQIPTIVGPLTAIGLSLPVSGMTDYTESLISLTWIVREKPINLSFSRKRIRNITISR